MATEDAETKPDESIASLLAAAVTESEKAETPAEPEKEAVAEPELKPEVEPEKAADEAEEKAEPAEAEAKEPAEKPSEKEGIAPPAQWPKRDKEMFARVADPAVQSWLLDRTKAMEADYTKKTMAAAQLRKEYEPVDTLFAPHRDAMKQKGLTPHSLIEAWMGVEKRLAGGPDSAIAVLQGLVNGYGIPVAKLAAALGLAKADEPQATEQQQQNAEVQLPPAVAAKLDALGKIQERLDRDDREKAQRAQREARAAEEAETKRIDDFKGETDGKGNLLHPHFSEIEDDMLNLALGYRASNKPIPPLAELYERAVNANPATRAKVLAALKQQEEAAQRDADRKKAAQAKKAASSVTGSPGGGQAPPTNRGSDKSLREQLEEAYEDTAA